MDTTQMLYSSGISIGAYSIYKIMQYLYHKYYLKSECHQRTLEITVIDREEKKDIELEKK
jgi:hypothetical protein